MVLIAQICGFLSLFFMVLSYISKNKEAYLGKQVIANSLYGLQYFLLNATTGFSTSVISIIKTVLFHLEQRKKGYISFILLIVFEIAYIIVGIFSVSDFISLIPIIIAIVYTWAAWQPNLKITCVAGIVVGLLWIVYNVNVGAYVAIINGVVESISGIIGLLNQCKVNKVIKG